MSNSRANTLRKGIVKKSAHNEGRAIEGKLGGHHHHPERDYDRECDAWTCATKLENRRQMARSIGHVNQGMLDQEFDEAVDGFEPDVIELAERTLIREPQHEDHADPAIVEALIMAPLTFRANAATSRLVA